MTKKRRITVYLLAILFALSVSFMFIAAFNQSNAVFAASIFEYDGKVKTVAGDEDGGKRGLRLFAYDSGATANFKGVQTDIFQSEIKIASFGGNSNLRKYSLRFKDEKSGKSFSVQVSSYSDYNDIGVIYNGAKGGIVYHEASNLPYGVTAGYNEQSVYTKFTADICSLTFDPESMQVKIKGDDGNYRLVWDFTKQYNDGKLIESDLEPFAEYSVAVVFDEIAANSRGDLLLCSFGGYSLAESNVEYRPAIILSSEIKPVLNKNYVFPSAKITSENGADVSDKIVASLYDENGKLLAKNVKNYTPAEKGTLYLYYEYSENGGTSDAWYKTEVIEQSEITEKFVYAADLPETVGLNAKVYVPDASVITNILASGREECFVTVKKDGKVVSGYEKIDGDFYLKVTETGVYEIEYSGKKSGEYNKEIKRITVDDGILAVNIDDIPDSFAVGSTYEFPSAEFYLGDETAVVTAKIITPYGEQKSGEITFSEVGKYTLDYTAVLGGENRNCSKDIFVKHKITDDFDTDASYSSMKSNNETTGVKLTLTDNKTITYGKTIDLSEYTFNDKTNNGKTLLEVSFDPKNIGSTDLDSFFVVLTDKYDSTNYISVRLKYLSYTPMATFMRARAANQTAWVGYYYDFFSTARRADAATTHEEGGFICSGSFTHAIDNYDFDFMSMKLYFDYETKCLYSQPLWLTGHDDLNGHPEYNSRLVPWLVYDFDSTDTELSAGNKPWNGFSTGEVILSIYAKGASSGADVFMLTVDGENLSDPLFDDNQAPIVTVDVDENAVPFAKVGSPYKIFDYTATDADSKITDKGVVVINDASGKTAEINVDGTFTPLEGTYTFLYYAVDAFGHRTEKKIRVTAKRNIDEPSLSVSSDMPSQAKYGETVTIADYEVTNVGAGMAAVTIDVKCGNESIPVVNGKFECKGAAGIYTVTYTITDYIGQSGKVRKRINVTRSEELGVNEESINLPKAFMHGDKFVFDNYTAVYYDANLNEIIVPATITVVDGNGTTTIGQDGVYSPKATESRSYATVTVSFARDRLKKTIARDIPIRTAKNGDGYIANYFVTNNASISMNSNGLTFTDDGGEEMSFSFVRPIFAEEATFRFIAEASRFNAQSFNVTLSDKQNGLQKIVLTFTKSGKLWYCSLNGCEKALTYADADGYLQINYNNANKTVTDANGSIIGVADKTAGGAEFVGFASGYLYLDCNVTGISSTTEIGIRTINNQTINSVKRDMQKPYIKAVGAYDGRVPVGEEIKLGSVIAYDVLSPLGEVTVNVKLGAETFITEKTLREGETFKVNECGKYIITFKVADKNGNSATDYVDFSVYDPVKPTLEFDRTLESEVKVGRALKLSGYTVKDNQKDKVVVRIYVISPDGAREAVNGGEYTFGKKGTYTVVYMAADPNNNFVIYRFVVKAV